MGEIILFIAIFVFLVCKLYSMFGHSGEFNDDEILKKKYARYIWHFESEDDENGDGKTVTVEQKPDNSGKYAVEKTDEDMLVDNIKEFFPNFNTDHFKSAILKLYALLFQSFEKGSFLDIEKYVTGDILKQLKDVFLNYDTKNEIFINSDITVDKITITEIAESEKYITVTIDILAKRCCYVQSKFNKETLKGDDNKLEIFEEVWQLQKDKSSTDHAWIISMVKEK